MIVACVTVAARRVRGRICWDCPWCKKETDVLVDGGPPASGERFEVACGLCRTVCTVQVRTAVFA